MKPAVSWGARDCRLGGWVIASDGTRAVAADATEAPVPGPTVSRPGGCQRGVRC